MNEQIKSWYLELADKDKQVFLAFVSNHLTVHGRAFGLDLTGDKQIAAFKGLNELHHQISSHIAGIGLGIDRYPDDVLWNILRDKAALYDISSALTDSFEFASSRSCWSDAR